MNNANLLKRQTIEVLLNNSRKVIENVDCTPRKFIITPQDKVVLSELITVLCASISSYHDIVTPGNFFSNYLTISGTTGHRTFYQKGTHKVDKDVMILTLNECEEIANKKLGTLEDLKKNNDVNKELVVQ